MVPIVCTIVHEFFHNYSLFDVTECALIRLEKVNIRSLRSLAKILGTVLCVGGAMSMALLKGPKLLNAEKLPGNSVFGSGDDDQNWLLGCSFLFASCCCWSIWLILQVLNYHLITCLKLPKPII